ncbi:MAG: hypothetical protein IPM95_09830 [Sphingobacteriales bacterium]|nr:hypothetical protein [Sphingobacteriales bacterium]
MISINYLKNTKAQYCLLLIISFLLYYKTIYFGFNLDDDIILNTIANKTPTLQDVWSLFNLSYNKTDYRPVVLLSYGIEQYIFGEINPSVSHAINVFLFYVICSIALSLFKFIFDNKHTTLYFFAVLLFCVHPLNTEVVCSLKCRDNLLSMLFGMLAFYCFIQFIELQNRKTINLFLFFLFTIIAILSKMDALGFLILCVAYVLFFKKEKKLIYTILSFLIILLLISIASLIKDNALSHLSATDNLIGKVTFTENPLAVSFTLQNRVIALVNTVYYYFTKMIPVTSYKYYYGYNYFAVLSVNTFSFYGGLIIVLSFIIALIAGIKKQDKHLIISLSAIFILSFYALNFYTAVAGIIADRYIFIANLFFCLLLTYSLYLILVFINKEKYLNLILLSIIIPFSLLSILRIPAWKNLKTLIDTDAPGLYNSYEAMRIAAGAYGKEYDKEKDEELRKAYLEKSIYYAEKGVRVYPKNHLLYLFLGQYYFQNKQTDQAIRCFKTAVKNNSSKIDSYVFLGDSYYSLKKMDSAIFYYKSGLRLQNNSQLLINNISTIYYEMNDKENCLTFNTDLISKDSTIFAAQENLGYYYLNERDTLTAKEYFRKAVKFGLNENSVPIKIK